nr:uncharacterized protein LOC129525425 [Gorilla gorilla gorilla]
MHPTNHRTEGSQAGDWSTASTSPWPVRNRATEQGSRQISGGVRSSGGRTPLCTAHAGISAAPYENLMSDDLRASVTGATPTGPSPGPQPPAYRTGPSICPSVSRASVYGPREPGFSAPPSGSSQLSSLSSVSSPIHVPVHPQTLMERPACSPPRQCVAFVDSGAGAYLAGVLTCSVSDLDRFTPP